jgi:peptidase A4-like protein
MTARLGRLVALVSGVLMLAATGGAGGSAAPAGGVLLPTHPGQVLPVRNADTTSLNWSGYAVVGQAGHPITGVTQNWIVPTVSTLPAGFSSTWAGIGGYNTGDLIQAGTESDTAQSPFAWYEILPASETPITSGCTGDPTCTVRPGDAMSVTIRSTGGSGWAISMTNPRWTWSTSLTYTSTFSSAEWILEAPTVGAQTVLANVGTQQFVAGTPGNTFTVDGVTKSIGQGSPVRIILSPGLINEATPSALNSAGTAFNDCAYKQSCPAPA